MATFLCLSVAHILEFALPGKVLLLLVLALPTAWIGAKLEAWQRVWQNVNYDRAFYWIKNDIQAFRPGILIGRGVAQIFLLQSGLFVVIALLFILAVPEIAAFWPLSMPGLNWAHLWSAALVGGILSLRIKAAYSALLVGTALLVFILWFTTL